MSKYLIRLALLLAVVATYAVAQQPGSPAGQAGNQSQAGASGQTGSQQQQQEGAAASASGAQEEAQKPAEKHNKSAKVDDQTLERQVHEQLSSNPAFRNIQVSVNKGVVDLEGSVPNKDDKKEVIELARAVQGVRKVKEHLNISASGAMAGAGTAAGVSGSAGSSSAPAGENTAGSISGNTSAAAGTQAGAAKPETSSESAPGQAGEVSGASAQVQNRIQQALQKDAALASSVNANVANNQVILSGTVPSAQEKQRAEELAEANADGLQVVNNINVSSSAGAAAGTAGGVSGAATGAQPQPPASSGQAGAVSGQAGAQQQGTTSSGAQGTTSETGGMAPDQLKAQIQNAFQSEPTLSSCNITTNVSADTIELAGTCPTGKEKQTARRMAQSLAGNRRVVDRITVTGEGREKGNQPPSQTPPPQH